MTLTTPPRPLDVEALFPGLAAHRATATRLHPRPGRPTVRDSHVGGPLLWPAGEPWPECEEPHPHAGPLLAVAQLHTRDIPDLAAGPDGCDLLQLLWCPFDLHGPTGHGMHVRLTWRRSAEVGEVSAPRPGPERVGFEGYVPRPCVLHPERVVEYPYIELLAGELGERVEKWEDAQEEAADDDGADGMDADPPDRGARDGDGSGDGRRTAPPTYQGDLSVAPGWKAGGHAVWNVTGPGSTDCRGCGRAMRLLLTVDSYEWRSDSASWRPLPADPAADADRPTGVAVGNYGRLNVFACPHDPAHPHRFSVQ
ncbi:hypothetical protein [Streptomyces sp. NRRL F-2664]|uniref:hypothetical protein n=1 Tax=Streptomyces sp. NRRL F-2664 TaxID=1463842 RepID=UPI0004C6A868|nr:hypothetical protein [Streptomyces sp. NRRL F-2664]